MFKGLGFKVSGLKLTVRVHEFGFLSLCEGFRVKGLGSSPCPLGWHGHLYAPLLAVGLRLVAVGSSGRSFRALNLRSPAP